MHTHDALFGEAINSVVTDGDQIAAPIAVDVAHGARAGVVPIPRIVVSPGERKVVWNTFGRSREPAFAVAQQEINAAIAEFRSAEHGHYDVLVSIAVHVGHS